MATVTGPMTVEEFLALPDDGVHRELIRGELREESMTTRDYPHGRVTMNLGYLLGSWLRAQPEPRGRLVGGEARLRIKENPNTVVGVDAAYISPELAGRTDPNARLVDGIPTLVVEILSPSDVVEDVLDKAEEYLACGVPVVWLAIPRLPAVLALRPDARPRLFNVGERIDAEPHMPGLRVLIDDVFE
jgi:Uma2 family endonuclease